MSRKYPRDIGLVLAQQVPDGVYHVSQLAQKLNGSAKTFLSLTLNIEMNRKIVRQPSRKRETPE